MSSPTTTLFLLIAIILLAMLKSGRLIRILNLAFG